MLNKLTDELAVCGFNAALAAVEYNSENVNRLFLREDRLKSFYEICRQLAEKKRPYKICQDDELEKICKTKRHQGVVVMVKAPSLNPLSREDLASWAEERKTGLVLHSVGNDHNLGAIARSAAFFDAPLIVITKPSVNKGEFYAEDDSPEEDKKIILSSSAYRTAEGGMEHVKVRWIQKTSLFLHDASKKLIVIGTDTRARLRIKDLPQIIESKAGAIKSAVRPGIAVVLGNEETGLPPDVKEACTCLVRIPGTGLMDCLNVSQAAALFLNEIYNL